MCHVSYTFFIGIFEPTILCLIPFSLLDVLYVSFNDNYDDNQNALLWDTNMKGLCHFMNVDCRINYFY